MDPRVDSKEVLTSGKLTISPFLNTAADNIAGALIMLGYRDVSIDMDDRAPIIYFSDLEPNIVQPTFGELATTIRPDNNIENPDPFSGFITSVLCDKRDDSYAELRLVAE